MEPIYTYPRWSLEADCLATGTEVPADKIICQGAHCHRPRSAAELFDASQYPDIEGDWICAVCFSDQDRVEAKAAEEAARVPCWSPECETRNHVYALRRQYLTDSDWTQVPGVVMDAGVKADWDVYRQALRDLTETYASPDLVVWPTSP